MSQRVSTFESNLLVREAEGIYREATNDEVIVAARRALGRRLRRGRAFTNPDIARDYLRVQIGTLEYEVFVVVVLDAQHRLIEVLEMFRGTINQTSVYPREVVKETLARNGAAVIFAHNHPSGLAEPSRADELLTQRLKAALDLVDVRVLDHLIVAGNDVMAFSERGLL